MTNALFLDLPNIIKTKSKQDFPLHREDWYIPQAVKDTIKKHLEFNYKILLVGNYPEVYVSKRQANPIENLMGNIAEALELEFKLPVNSVAYDYCTDSDSFEYLPLPGMFYNLAYEHELLLGYSFIITNDTVGKFIQQYSGIKPVIAK